MRGTYFPKYRVIFEGDYLNKANWNEKGKDYFVDDKLILWNGKGKEYNKNGQLIFEGEYLNGKRWNGKGYNKNGIIEFEIKNGKGKGKGKEYTLNVIISPFLGLFFFDFLRGV